MEKNNFNKEVYERVDKTFSLKKANLFAIISVIPMSILAIAVYYFLERERPESNYLHILIIFFVGIFIHEFIHGFTWSIFCENKFKSIKFGFDKKTLSPYTTCSEILNINGYKIGAIMPFIITGLLPYLTGLIINNETLVYSAVVLMDVAIGDIMILTKLIGEKKSAFVEDHPTDCGCVVYRALN